MSTFGKLFDEYSLSARVRPAFFTVLPVVLLIFYRFQETRGWGGAIATFIISFGVIAFIANQLSTRGNIIQKKLYEKWGGAPTTIILRHSDKTFDKHTKQRLFDIVSNKIGNVVQPTKDAEVGNPTEADETYRSIAQYLKEHTRDTKKFPLVFKELINYGFARNMFCIKSIGVIITCFSISLCLFLIWYIDLEKALTFSISSLAKIPYLSFGLLAVLFVLLLSWAFWVTEEWVKIRGFCYAKALTESSEHL
ncbi:MAG: hypothetical protein JW915_16210 [Chitinispirillaceae bacterium]|nr:hypothetical protein [Chitinispirillaceae bacterium]